MSTCGADYYTNWTCLDYAPNNLNCVSANLLCDDGDDYHTLRYPTGPAECADAALSDPLIYDLYSDADIVHLCQGADGNGRAHCASEWLRDGYSIYNTNEHCRYTVGGGDWYSGASSTSASLVVGAAAAAAGIMLNRFAN